MGEREKGKGRFGVERSGRKGKGVEGRKGRREGRGGEEGEEARCSSKQPTPKDRLAGMEEPVTVKDHVFGKDIVNCDSPSTG